MTKLSELITLPIKIDVSSLTETERAELQTKLFEYGVVWLNGKTVPLQLNSEYLYIKVDNRIVMTYSSGSIKYFLDQTRYTEVKVDKLKEILGMTRKQFTKAAFTKADLKDGMVVLLRGYDTRHLVLNNRFIDNGGWMGFDSYNDDLLHCDSLDTQYDVVEVFEVERASDLDITKWKLKSIWKREEKSAASIAAQLEIEEIQKQMDQLNAQLEALKASV